MPDHKEYLKQQYQLAMLDYQCARTEDEQWQARKYMANTQRTAAELYGFEFADSLQTRKEAVK